MQVNRLHKILSARTCEFLFLIKKSYRLIKDDLMYKLFGKKNPFIDEPTQKGQAGIKDEKLQGSMRDFEMNQSVEVSTNKNRLASDAFFDSNKAPGAALQGPSQTLKTLYTEISSFDKELMKNLNIMYVVQSNPFISTGFN